MIHKLLAALRGAFRRRDPIDRLSLRELRELGLWEDVARREADTNAHLDGRW